MLKGLVPKLLCPTCRNPDHALTAHVFTEGTDGHIQDGILLCEGCRAWCPIEGDLLELVDSSLLVPDDHARFCARFQRQLADLGLTAEPAAATTEGVTEQLRQREHFDGYAKDDKHAYGEYQQTPFWVAFDRKTYGRWSAMMKPGGWLLDIGCADGRSAFPLLSEGRTVIGFDISKKIVAKAIARAKAEGVHGRTSFLVSDAHQLAFRDQSFDYALTYGVLHHLPDPVRTCRDIQRLLAVGGIYFGCENTKSIFRAAFDFLMKLRPLWVDLPGEEPLITPKMVRDWVRELPVRVETWTSVFLPPHLFNLLGRTISWPLLRITDGVCTAIPGLRNQGGLICFEITKTGQADGPAAPVPRAPVPATV